MVGLGGLKLLWVLEGVPLGNGSTRGVDHVHPVLEPFALLVGSHGHFANGVAGADPIVVQAGEDQVGLGQLFGGEFKGEGFIKVGVQGALLHRRLLLLELFPIQVEVDLNEGVG